MKKEQRKSKFWLMGGLAALTFLSAGSMAAAQTVTSYNDLAWGTGQLNMNITTFTSPNGGSGLLSNGQLKDFATGNATAVTLEVTGGSFVGDAQAAQGANPTMGDAFAAFDTKVNGLGVLSYTDAPGPGGNLVLTFTNMNPNKVYDLTFFADRNADGWDRASLVTISGQDVFVNTSSVAADNPDTVNYPGGVLFTGPASPETRLPSANPNGYVARFSNVKSGSDGTVVLTISFDGSVGEQFKGKYGSALRLIESGNTSNDVNADGKADIVWRNTNDGSVAAWLMNGLSASSKGLLAGTPPAAWVIKGVGDVNGDGKADLVWRNTSTGEVAVWLLDGLNAPTKGLYAGMPTAAWVIKGVGDVNGDGKADLVWRNTSTGEVAVWLLDGLNAPTTGVLAGVPSATWDIKGVGDVDGDGKADLVWRNTADGSVAVWLLDGLNAPTKVVYAGMPTAAWVIKGVGDVNGDGKADLVWRNTSTGEVAVWLLDGLNAPTTGVLAGAPSAAWDIKSVGDLNGDGNADLVWRETNTGDLAGWLLDGLNAPTKGVIMASVPLEWEIRP